MSTGPYDKREGGRIRQFLLEQEQEGKIDLSDPQKTLNELSQKSSNIPKGSFTGKVLEDDAGEDNFGSFFQTPEDYIQASRKVGALRGPRIPDTNWCQDLNDWRPRLIPSYPDDQMSNRPRLPDNFMKRSTTRNAYNEDVRFLSQNV